VWLKGPVLRRGAHAHLGCFEAVRNALTKVWNTERLFLQAHVTGYENP
jgi:hypothetical protein